VRALLREAEGINASLLSQLENERGERVREKWLASQAVFERRLQAAQEYERYRLNNKMFYLSGWSGVTSLGKYSGGFTASWQIGRVLALRSGVDWIYSEFIHEIDGYRGLPRYVWARDRTLQVPILFEWAVRRGMISVQGYGGAYMLGNIEGGAPGLTGGLDIGVKAWRGYGFVGFQSGAGLVEYDGFNVFKLGYKFGLLTKHSHRVKGRAQ